MASIRQEISIDAPSERVWDAVRDVGAIHERLAPGFVVDTTLEDGGAARVVKFGNGMVARELIVDLDDERRRLAWSVVGGRMTHHNASLQILVEDASFAQRAEGEPSPSGPRCRAVWIADLLPHELGPAIAAMIAQGLEAMKKTLERGGCSG
jgi:polyketide cyclase/dehydrase/lipid transport protein